jgi:hypothetical protein
MYKNTPTGNGIFRLSDNAFIPLDESNSDYQAYLEWSEAGGIAQPADVPVLDRKGQARLELAQLEQATMMNKGMREFFMVSMQDIATRQSEQMAALDPAIIMSPRDILAHRPAWVKLVAINEQALALEKEAGL